MREVQMIWDVMNEKCPIKWLLKLLNKPEVQIFFYLIFKEKCLTFSSIHSSVSLFLFWNVSLANIKHAFPADCCTPPQKRNKSDCFGSDFYSGKFMMICSISEGRSGLVAPCIVPALCVHHRDIVIKVVGSALILLMLLYCCHWVLFSPLICCLWSLHKACHTILDYAGLSTVLT